MPRGAESTLLSEASAWIAKRLPPDRDLEPAELAELATAVGRERRLWEALARHDAEARFFLQLYRDMHVDVWLQCWANQQDNGFHDHDVSSGAVCVAEGVLMEDRLRRVGDGVLREEAHERPAGATFCFGPAHVHRIRHPGGVPASSIHAYSPAIWRMGHYDLDADGNLTRTSITYVDEMG